MLKPMLAPEVPVASDSLLPRPRNRVSLAQLIARANTAEAQLQAQANQLAQLQDDLRTIEALVTVQRDAQGNIQGLQLRRLTPTS